MEIEKHYIVHPTGYLRDDYILRKLLSNAPDAMPLALLRRTVWHVCRVPLDDFSNIVDISADDEQSRQLIEQLTEAWHEGEPIEPILVLGPEKRLLAGHESVKALAALGEADVLAYHGELI